MMKNCIIVLSHSKVKVGENGRSVIFLNPSNSEITVGQVDDCLITDGIRSDNLIHDDTHIVFVEFKGCDLNHACKQLFATATHASMGKFIRGKQIGFLIVCSRYPRNNTSVQMAQSKAMRQYKAGFKVVCNKGEFRLNAISGILQT
jgi:hypothetical protein